MAPAAELKRSGGGGPAADGGERPDAGEEEPGGGRQGDRRRRGRRAQIVDAHVAAAAGREEDRADIGKRVAEHQRVVGVLREVGHGVGEGRAVAARQRQRVARPLAEQVEAQAAQGEEAGRADVGHARRTRCRSAPGSPCSRSCR